MGRENCSMCDDLGDKRFCSYFDVFFAECENVSVCPDGLDDEDDDDDQYYYDEDDFDNDGDTDEYYKNEVL